MELLVGWMLLLKSFGAPATAPDPPSETAPAVFARPVAESVLEGERGGDGLDLTQLGWVDEKALVTGNVVFSTVNGANSLGEGALSGVNGIATVIQNSGNQVIIQNALILNLTLR